MTDARVPTAVVNRQRRLRGRHCHRGTQSRCTSSVAVGVVDKIQTHRPEPTAAASGLAAAAAAAAVDVRMLMDAIHVY